MHTIDPLYESGHAYTYKHNIFIDMRYTDKQHNTLPSVSAARRTNLAERIGWPYNSCRTMNYRMPRNCWQLHYERHVQTTCRCNRSTKQIYQEMDETRPGKLTVDIQSVNS